MKCPDCSNDFDFIEDYHMYTCSHCQTITLSSDHPLIQLAENMVEPHEWNKDLMSYINSKEFETFVQGKLLERLPAIMKEKSNVSS